MQLKLYDKPFPTCPHLKGSNGKEFCSYLSNKIGREAGVTRGLCNEICKCGQKVDSLVVAAEKNYANQHLKGNFIARVLESYKELRPIGIPSFWNEIQEELKSVLALPYVVNVSLTGSAIFTDKAPTKDLDLILSVTSFEDLPNNIYDLLPKKIGGLQTDWFIRQSSPWAAVFPILSPSTMTLLIPSTFPMQGRAVQEGINVLTVEGMRLNTEPYRETVEHLMPTPKKEVAQPNAVQTKFLSTSGKRQCGKCSRAKR